MVIVKGEQRFYGRGETGNYVLSQAEVARLYERRRTVASDILPLLEKAVQQIPPSPDGKFAHLHIVARPLLARDDIIIKALAPQQDPPELLHELVERVQSSRVFKCGYVPDIGRSYWTRKPEGYFCQLNYDSRDDNLFDGRIIRLQVNLDGGAYLFCGRAAEIQNGPKWFFSGGVAGNTTKLLAVLGPALRQELLLWNVDIGVAVTGLNGCAPFETRHRFHSMPRFEDSDYKRTIRVPAMSLLSNPQQVAADLLMPLIEAISQGTDNPFKDQ